MTGEIAISIDKEGASRPVINLHYGPEWLVDQNRPGAIEARAQVEESLRKLLAVSQGEKMA